MPQRLVVSAPKGERAIMASDYEEEHVLGANSLSGRVFYRLQSYIPAVVIGLMFWFSRNRFVGSYFSFSASNR